MEMHDNFDAFMVKVPATSANMGPGFDSFGVALKLYNTFVFRPLYDEPNKLIFKADFSLRQSPRSNLVYKSYLHTLRSIRERSIPGIEISIISEVPSARGLGSSASAVVAGILGAGAVCNVNLKLSEVIDLATEIEGHPDNVAPAMLGGMTVSIQEPDFVYTEKIEWPSELDISVAIPEIKVHTNASRNALPKRVPLGDAVFNLQRAALFIAALKNKDWNGLRLAMHDKLHQNQRAPLVPGLIKILSSAKNNGAIGAVLSGSGPSVLIITLASKSNNLAKIEDDIKLIWQRMRINSTFVTAAVQEHTTRIKRIGFDRYEELTKFIEPVIDEGN